MQHTRGNAYGAPQMHRMLSSGGEGGAARKSDKMVKSPRLKSLPAVWSTDGECSTPAHGSRHYSFSQGFKQR